MNNIQREILNIASFFSQKCILKKIKYSLLGGSSLGAIRHKGFIPWDDDFDVILLPEDYKKLMQTFTSLRDGNYFFLREGDKYYEMPFSKIMSRNLIFKEYNLKENQKFSGLYIDIMGFVYTYNSFPLRYLHFCIAKLLLILFLYRRGYKTKILLKKILLFFASLVSPFLPNSYKLILFFRAYSPRKTKFLGHFFGKAAFNKSVYPEAWFRNTELVDFEDEKFPNTKFFKNYLRMRYGDEFMKIPDKDSKARYPAHGEFIGNYQ